MRSVAWFLLLASSVACIVAGYYDNLTGGVVAVMCLMLTWRWSRAAYLNRLNKELLGRSVYSAVKRTQKQGMRSNRPA